MATHEKLVQAATDAINAVFFDTSVSVEVTRESLEGLREEIDMILETLSDETG